jgi:predicted transcriptional regulator
MDAQSANPHLTAKIVGSYLRHHTVGASELPNLITSVHRALTDVGQPNPPKIPLTPAVSVRQSVRHDVVVCLDCGYRGKMLRRHISTRHGLSPKEYLRRWGLNSDHPLTAPAYSESRSILAKELGLGQKSTTPNVPVETPPEAEMPVATEPEIQAPPARRPRSRSKRGDGESAAEATPPARRRRSRSRRASPQTEATTSLPETEPGTGE